MEADRLIAWTVSAAKALKDFLDDLIRIENPLWSDLINYCHCFGPALWAFYYCRSWAWDILCLKWAYNPWPFANWQVNPRVRMSVWHLSVSIALFCSYSLTVVHSSMRSYYSRISKGVRTGILSPHTFASLFQSWRMSGKTVLAVYLKLACIIFN